jgi:flagellin-like hook-associated protein FlgL
VAFTINTNISSLQAQEYLRQTSDFQAKTIGRVTSGLRILNAGDDAAGLAIANSYRSDQAVLTQGIRNASDGLATLQTIDGGVSNIGKLLDRARTLASQSASSTFTGDRTVLNAEFQNVLTEVNRQAQAIGMVSGGEFAKSLSVFIGGGRTISGGTSATANGAVTVDLSTSLLDTTSLGLGANGAVGTVDLRSSTNKLSTALGQAAASFTFYGDGFGTGVTVTVSASDWNAATITNEQDLVKVLNKAIESTAANNAAFAALGVRASLDPTTGKLAFNSSKAFQVDTASAGAATIMGSPATTSGGATGVGVLPWTDMTGTNTQSLIFSYRDSAGVLQTKQVDLDASVANSVDSIRHAVDTLNSTSGLNGWGGLFAVTNGTVMVILSRDGAEFSLSIGAGSAAEGINNGTLDEHGSNVSAGGSSLDISSSTTATSAVTSIASAVTNLASVQANVGKAQNQINFAVSLASTQVTNLAASESRIRDADLAQEAANLTKAQIMQQAGVAALAQANSAPQAVLSLLKG